jgi:hypothetical protein
MPSGVFVTVPESRAQPLERAAAGDDGHWGLRWTVTLAVGKLRVPVYLDFLGYAAGRDELSLLAYGMERPFPAALEQRLASITVARALARQA